MLPVFDRYKKKLQPFLSSWLEKNGKKALAGLDWGGDLLARLEQFVGEGKMIRGGLCLLGAELGSKPDNRSVVAVAAAVELFHSALLVHDDVLDQDRLRRGKDSLYVQYEKMALRTKLRNAPHFGEALAICAGDTALFLAWQLLASVDKQLLPSLIELFSRELARVAAAQMQDVWFASRAKDPTVADVLNLYRDKTARYTFSLPLLAGARLARVPARIERDLEKIGEQLGLLFQLKDDELGLYGDSQETGKPVGADIREGKKTIFYLTLIKKVSGAERRQLMTLYGNQNVGDAGVQAVRALLMKYHVREDVQRLAEQFYKKARRQINQLSASEKYRRILIELAVYSSARNK